MPISPCSGIARIGSPPKGLTPPRTWDDLLACARHFQRAAVRDRYDLDLYPLAFAGGANAGETTDLQLLPLLWSAGADVIVNHQVVLNSRQAGPPSPSWPDLVRKARGGRPPRRRDGMERTRARPWPRER